MIELNIKLTKNKNYINSGNIFSKLILLTPFLKKSNGNIIIVENEKKINTYLRISNFLKINLNILDNFSDIINILKNKNGNYIVTKEFFNININNFDYLLDNDSFKISKKDIISPQEVTKKLNSLNYKFSEYEKKASFKVMGDTLYFIDNNGNKLQITFWGDEIDDIILNDKKIENYHFGKKKKILDYEITNEFNHKLYEKINTENILKILANLDFYSIYDTLSSKIDNYIIFNSLSSNKKHNNLEIKDLYIEKIDDFKTLLENKNIKKYIFTKNKETIKKFLNLNNLFNVNVYDTNLNNLKSFKNENNIVICDDNISRIFIKKRVKRKLSKDLDLIMQIKPGDYIVHIDHGVGVFKEIITKDLSGIQKEYIELEYKNNDKLFIPITEVGRISKYVGVEKPKLTGLNSKEWEKKLKKATEDVEKIAHELLEVYAKRKIKKGFSFASDSKQETKFFKSFEYEYTQNQFNIIKEIYKDMGTEYPMDRLICGDVGFGKTEIAFASIFKAFINKKQSILISPLVVLAYEHFEKAKERFSLFNINIEILTRFEKQNTIKNTLKKLENGEINLIIGTHRLLSEDVKFKDLGLLVIDEEHKFGVQDKEKIKKLKGNIDILSMSATPIPRSLNMALNGIKSISMLTTPPVGRQAISTIVSSFNDEVILKAGKEEFKRKGQLFFIHNRVETIEVMKKHLQNIFPTKKIIITHGQLTGNTLEKRIIEFKKGLHDILLSTTVIENGIDFSNVNTIFINNAENFGISQIHQLRGRVGRSDKKGYCYLLFKKNKIKEDAAKRLKTIVDYSHLGAGFELAIKDLEIRGGGDILGIKQSGTGQEIGITLFLEMLENKIEELKNNSKTFISSNTTKNINTSYNKTKCSIDLNIGAYIDSSFFSSELDKINFYREIENLNLIEDLENIISDFKKINKNIPQNTKNFFDLLRIKIKATKFKIISIKRVGINYQIDFQENISLDELKSFLKLDKDVLFNVINLNRIRSSNKNFENEKKFIQYILQLFNGNTLKKKFKIKKILSKS